jgi:adenine-specific DNA-methyltransferase
VITAATIQSMGSKDGLCLLLPAQWLESNYASGLRSWLWAATSRPVRLHLFGHHLFPDAQVDTVSLLVGPVADRDHPLLLSSAGSDTDVELARLEESPARWRSLFSGAPKGRSSQPSGPPLSDFARIRRGVATGANSFFILTQPLVTEWSLPKATTAPIVRWLRGHAADEVTLKDLGALPARDRRWLLTATRTQVLADLRVATYIQHGEELNLPSRVLCQDRAIWHDLSGESTIPDVIVGPSTKSTFRFVQNLARAHIANNLYGLTWRPGVPFTLRTQILSWLRSTPGQRATRAAARTQGGGLLKIEPRAVSSLRLPVRFKPQAGHQG